MRRAFIGTPASLQPAGFVIGLPQSFLYGAYTGLLFTPIYNRFQKVVGGGVRGEAPHAVAKARPESAARFS